MVIDVGSNIEINIITNVNYYTAVFRRKYRLAVDAIADGVAAITLTWQDYTPSGYAKGERRGWLLESEELTIPQECSARQWLASLVLELHGELNQGTACPHLNKSRSIIKQKLQAITQQ